MNNNSAELSEFNAALSAHLVDYKELLQARSFQVSEPDPNSSPALLFNALGLLYAGLTVRILFYEFSDPGWESEGLELFLAGPDGIQKHVRTQASPASIQNLSNEWKASMQILERSAEQASVLRASLNLASIQGGRSAPEIERELSGLLLPESIWKELKAIDHLVIFPSQGIGTVPFCLLEIDETPAVSHFAISIASDVADLFDSLEKARQTKRSLPYSFKQPLIIGNPAYPVNSNYSFSNLPGAEAEARQIFDTIAAEAGTLLIGSQATQSNILQKAGEADLLFFGTHGISSSRNSLDESYLVLSEDPKQEPASAFWTAREIQHTELKADLAVLSACQSGLGVSHEAGLIGLARAFRLAGVDHVIMSLWNVNDQATQDLMVLFFNELLTKVHLSPATALRNAQLTLRETWPDPIDWAAFASFGLP